MNICCKTIQIVSSGLESKWSKKDVDQKHPTPKLMTQNNHLLSSKHRPCIFTAETSLPCSCNQICITSFISPTASHFWPSSYLGSFLPPKSASDVSGRTYNTIPKKYNVGCWLCHAISSDGKVVVGRLSSRDKCADLWTSAAAVWIPRWLSTGRELILCKTDGVCKQKFPASFRCIPNWLRVIIEWWNNCGAAAL